VITVVSAKAHSWIESFRALPAEILWLASLGRQCFQTLGCVSVGFIFFQTEALLILLVLVKLKGH